MLLVPTPGLRSGLFNRMENTSAGENTPENLRLLAQNDGMKRFSQSLQLDDAAKVDLVVVGSVAVSKSGKGNAVYIAPPHRYLLGSRKLHGVNHKKNIVVAVLSTFPD